MRFWKSRAAGELPAGEATRYALFSDVHSNLEALEAVLEDARERQATHYVCLGDIVGYMANPHECVEIVRELDCPTVKGNHDEMASLEDDLAGFSPLAEEAIHWTRQHLTASDKQWLRELKMVREVHDFTIVHATLDVPQKWGYVFNELDAAASFDHQRTQLCFYGHTHSPRAYVRDTSVHTAHLETLRVEKGKKYFINVGSVGQPRDGEWRASYCLYTPAQHTVELCRVPYDIHQTVRKVEAAGLHSLRRHRPDDPSGHAEIGVRPRFGPKRPGPLSGYEEWPGEEGDE